MIRNIQSNTCTKTHCYDTTIQYLLKSVTLSPLLRRRSLSPAMTNTYTQELEQTYREKYRGWKRKKQGKENQSANETNQRYKIMHASIWK